jgi:hypothetical protein
MDVWIHVGGGLPYPYHRLKTMCFAGDSLMELHLQFGFGMMSHTRELLEDWGGGTAILSPRDLTRDQLVKFSADVRERRGAVMLDPQCFIREADHERLVSHDFFAEFQSHSSKAFREGPGVPAVLEKLAALNQEMASDLHILPSLMAQRVNEAWFAVQEAVIEGAPKYFGGKEVVATVALGAEALLDEGQIEAVVERARSWDVAGFYVVPESPTGYLVDNPVWIANLLVLAGGLKLLKKKVIVGYSNHQMLCLASAKVDAIASGTWLNVRAFSPDKFSSPEEGAVSRRTTWFYGPVAMSEFKIPFLDIAKRMGVLDEVRPPPPLLTKYCRPLFAGATPTSVDWGEQSAFRHYLTALRTQAADASKSTFADTVAAHRTQIEASRAALAKLKRNGVFAQDRDFSGAADANEAALAVFERARGPRLRREW